MTQVFRRDSQDFLDAPAVLIVTGSHGLQPTKARFARASELVLGLGRLGAVCDLVVLLEKPLQPPEEDALEDLRGIVRELEVVPHPLLDSLLYKAALRVRDALSMKASLGGFSHCPARLLSTLRARSAAEGGYRAVIAGGAHLARVLALFPAWTEKLVDLERIGSDVHRDHDRQGRGDVLQVLEDAEREMDLLFLADATLVTSAMDAARLRELGHARDLVLTPPVACACACADACGPERDAREPAEPLRPPRILCVGSETAANLDGVRWFRRQVFPRIARAVPACRLRLVGEVARHIEPGPSVDRIGWVDRLDEEYRDCAVVALPLRMGAGLRRRAVEALARGKAFAATPAGAAGAGLVHLRDAIVTEDAAALAAEISRALASDSLRKAYERRAIAIARESFGPERAFAALAERLGLGKRARGRAAVASPLVMA